jgi:hypothetical protein
LSRFLKGLNRLLPETVFPENPKESLNDVVLLRGRKRAAILMVTTGRFEDVLNFKGSGLQA